MKKCKTCDTQMECIIGNYWSCPNESKHSSTTLTKTSNPEPPFPVGTILLDSTGRKFKVVSQAKFCTASSISHTMGGFEYFYEWDHPIWKCLRPTNSQT